MSNYDTEQIIIFQPYMAGFLKRIQTERALVCVRLEDRSPLHRLQAEGYAGLEKIEFVRAERLFKEKAGAEAEVVKWRGERDNLQAS